jgi:hypothetical protein
MLAATLQSPVYQPAPPPAAFTTPAPPTPFGLTQQRDDVALLQDARTGFSHLLPGRPAFGASHPGEADVAIQLQDAPLAIRYRLTPPAFTAQTAFDLARGTAEGFASYRAGARVAVESAEPSWLAMWGVEAAAVARYDVADGASHEDLFVLVRQGLVMTVTWTYPRGFADDPAYAAFAAVAEATMIWDPLRWEQRGRVWPESDFHGPGLRGAPRPKHNEGAKQVAAARARIPHGERIALLAILSGIVSRAGAPWVPVAPDVAAADKAALLDAAREPAVRAFLEHAFADVRTGHDLRGLAILLGRALGAR